MKAAAEKARSAVVIGGGFIGMLAAEALRKLDIRLTIVEMAAQLLPQLLDARGHVCSAGGRRRRRGVAARGDRGGGGETQGEQIEVSMKGGENIVADMIAVAAGVKPNLPASPRARARPVREFCVDGHLPTGKPDIFAAGDVAEVGISSPATATIHAIWPTAVEQGRLAGANMAGAASPIRAAWG